MRLLILVIFLTSCGQDFNSHTFDESRYGSLGIVSDAEGSNFVNAYNLIQTKCTDCHLGYHNDYAAYTTSQDWIDNNLVVAGDFDNSPIRAVLKNYGGDMPLQGTKFSDEEITTLQTWINSL